LIFIADATISEDDYQSRMQSGPALQSILRKNALQKLYTARQIVAV